MSDTKLDVRVYPIDEPKGSTLAFASVAVDDLVAIRGVRVVDGEKGPFVAMPQSRESDGTYKDIVFPLNGVLRGEITAAVLGEHERVTRLAPEQRGYDTTAKDSVVTKIPEDVKLDVRVYPQRQPKGRTKAYASVSVDDKIAIRGVRVVGGDKGLFVAMPQSQDSENKFRDVAFPISGELRKTINKAILEKYERGEKSADKTNDKTLADGLRKGAEKAAGQPVTPKDMAAKSRPGVLE